MTLSVLHATDNIFIDSHANICTSLVTDSTTRPLNFLQIYSQISYLTAF